MSVSAPEGTYFITCDSRRDLTFTRDGSLAVRDGRLVDAQGRTVCGLRESDNTPIALSVDAVDDALGRIEQPTIERDGSVVYRREVIEPRTGVREFARVVIGRIALARFPAGTKLDATEGNELHAPKNVAPQLGLPGDAQFGLLAPMHRERSRIDIDQGLIRLKDAYLSFEALAAAEAAKSHLGKTAMDLVK
jgi:flagellar hook protein FlgE